MGEGRIAPQPPGVGWSAAQGKQASQGRRAAVNLSAVWHEAVCLSGHRTLKEGGRWGLSHMTLGWSTSDGR